MRKPLRASSEQTRTALVAAGLRLFGHKGFEATPIRDIATEAKTNVASIAYHFGSKEGLRLACAQAVVERIREIAGEKILISDPGGDSDEALAILEEALTAMVDFIAARPEAGDIAAFMIREMADPGDAVDHIYAELIAPVHAALCRLWATATGGDPESHATRLAVFAMAGQIIYFRVGRPVILKRMGWRDIGPAEVTEIAATVIGNLRSIVAAARAGGA
jgi:AcrR family transcriptional regulator